MSKIILDLSGGTGVWSKKYKENGYTVHNITLPDYDILKATISKYYEIIRFRGQNKKMLFNW